MFAVSEAHVYRRLALAELPQSVLDALQTNEINLSNAASFTISQDEKVSLEVLERVKGGGYALDERLTSNPPRGMWEAKDLGASFRAFRKKRGRACAG